MVEPSAFSLEEHWSFQGVTCIFGARNSGKSDLARTLVSGSGAQNVVVLGAPASSFATPVTVVSTWDEAQTAVKAAREAGQTCLLVVDGFHEADALFEKQGWLRHYLLTCRGAGCGALIVYETPFFMGRLTRTVKNATNDLFIGAVISNDEGRSVYSMVSTVSDDINRMTKQLMETVSRAQHTFLHVRADAIEPEQRFHLVVGQAPPTHA